MANTEMGEFVVGAYLKLVEHCDVVDYNVRLPGGGLAGLNELDVVGFRFHDDTAFLCEVTTHLDGTLYGSSNGDTMAKLRSKHEFQQAYAQSQLEHFPHKVYQLWSPRVPRGKSLGALTELSTDTGLELIVNGEYARRVRELEALAKKSHHDSGNPFFRALQIVGNLRE
jgi:hypothetical protein